jgi:hypothetical protein
MSLLEAMSFVNTAPVGVAAPLLAPLGMLLCSRFGLRSNVRDTDDLDSTSHLIHVITLGQSDRCILETVLQPH